MKQSRLSPLVALLSLLFIVAAPASAAAQQGGSGSPDPPPGVELQWNENWPKFGAPHGIATGIGLGGAAAVHFLFPEPEEARWVNKPPADGKLVEVFESRTPRGRGRAAAASDILLGTLVTQSLVIDPWAVGGLTRQSPEVAAQTSLIGLQAMSLNLLATSAMKRMFARRRPDSYCPNGGDHCRTEANLSFPSGHASTAFTAAGLTCAHHMNAGIYGNEAADVATCATGLGVATGVGLLRMAAGRHHLTDVLAGAGLGLTFGWLMPKLIHYKF